jgi:ABC-type nitrate/sulfonate/bicarbonate transport system substrate-binding protein
VAGEIMEEYSLCLIKYNQDEKKAYKEIVSRFLDGLYKG